MGSTTERLFGSVMADYDAEIRALLNKYNIGFDDEIHDITFPRRPFEQGKRRISTCLHSTSVIITGSVKTIFEIQDTGADVATIREGLVWASTQDVRDYPRSVVIGLLGSVRQTSDGEFIITFLQNQNNAWFLNINPVAHAGWHGGTLFLKVIR